MIDATSTPPTRRPWRYRKIAVQFVFLAVVAVGAHYAAQYLYRSARQGQPPRQDKRDSALAVADDELDLGRVWETDRHEHTIHITNLLDRPVTITRFVKTCDCLGIIPAEGVPLQAHESKPFTLQLALVSRLGVAQQPEGDLLQVGFAARYSTDDQVEGGVTEWRLKGVIVPTLRFSPPVFQIGTRSDRQLAIEPAPRIDANDGIVAIDCDAPSDWSVAISRDQGSPPGPFTAVVRRKPEGKLGPVADVLRLTPIDREGKRLPTKELRIVGEIVPDVLGDPREIQHGRQPCGATAEETIRLVSLTNHPFRVKNVRSRSADLQVTSVPDREGVCLYSLQLRFTATGEQQVEAVFSIQEDDAKEFEVAVPVRYHGVRGP